MKSESILKTYSEKKVQNKAINYIADPIESYNGIDALTSETGLNLE